MIKIKQEFFKILIAVVNLAAFNCDLVSAGDYDVRYNKDTNDINYDYEIFRNESPEADGLPTPFDNDYDIVCFFGYIQNWLEVVSTSPLPTLNCRKSTCGLQYVNDGRPTWMNSENWGYKKVLANIIYDPEVLGIDTQVSFFQGNLCKNRTKGSSKADIAILKSDGNWVIIEVKNYSQLYFGNLRNVLNNQLDKYYKNLPDETTVLVYIDLRGQDVSDEKLQKLLSGLNIDPANVYFVP